jgi:hypothetical protein
MLGRLVLLLPFGVGCGAPTHASPSAPSGAWQTAPDAPSARGMAPAVAAPSSASSASSVRQAPAELKLELMQVLSTPVSSIALGEGSRLAVLADPPQVGDARGLHALPLPSALRAKPGEVDDAQIFYGRDNEPRVMGTRRSSTGENAIYWRHTAALGWRDGREEIAQLGGAQRGGLWGVLGSADPELVCRSNAQCLIKRSTGWTTAPAGAAARAVTLQDGVLWGLDASGIAGIDARGWALAIPAPAWSAPRAFWATRGEAWVSTERELFHFQDGAWSALPSPLSDVNACWGSQASSVWFAGKGGVAHYDGRGFAIARVPGSLRVIRGRSDDEVWLGGDAGLFRAHLP